MLSVYTLKSAAKAADYYQQENYYAKTTLPFQGHWFGKGAESLGLSGNGELNQFKDVLLGKLSPEIMMEQTKKGKYHRPGYDLTFSAPKSVSILATLLDNESILLAHRTAVQKVLTIIESEYAATRVKGDKGLTIEKTGNLIFSIFEHNDSRALDPELHSHAILMNATQRENGEWRTLYSYPLYRDKILLGMYYRAFLAQELMKLGFEIVQTSHQGTFELKDFPPSLIKQFSKRREQIKEELAKSGHSGGKAAKVANFNTRPPKRQVEPEHLSLAWTIELNRCGYSLEWLQQYVDMAKKRGPLLPPNPQKLAEDALRNAITHLSEWQGVFTLKELKKSALGLSIISHSQDGLEKAVVRELEKGDLLYVGDNHFTTQTARDLEIQNSAAMRLGKKQMAPIFGKLSAKYISGKLFEREHEKKVFEGLLTHQDREMVLHYHRKSDFKALMSPYIHLVRQYYLYPTVLTQSAIRAKALSSVLGTEYSRTITGFLFSLEKRLKKTPHPKPLAQVQQGREVWIVDGESEIGLGQVRELQRYAQHFGARIIWGQMAFSITPAIQSLIKQGIREMTLMKAPQEKIFRNLTQENLKALLQELTQNNQFIEISDWKKREAEVVQKYLQLSDDTSVWVYSKTERHSLNQQIRAARQKEGVLSGSELTVQTLQPIKLTKVQRSLAKFYQLNDVVKITKENLTLGITAHSYLTVKDIQLSAKTLTLADEAGKEISWQLNRKNAAILQLYRPETRLLQVNDWITWNQTIRYPDNRTLDRLSGEKAKVVAIVGAEFKVELNNKNILILDKNNKKDTHWDYGYAINHRQMETENFSLIVVLNSQAERLYEVFAKALMDAGKEVTIFCDDALKVEECLLQGNTRLLALDKPVTYYAPSVENKEEKQLQEYFPKYSARIQGYFAEHRQLLETVLKEYETEKLSLTLFDLKEAQINEKKSSVPVVTDSFVSFALAQEKESKSHTENEMKEIREVQVREACHAIDWICAKYGERKAVFDLKQLQEELFKTVGLTIPAQILGEQLQFALEKGILLPVSEEIVSKQGVEEKKTLVATREMVALEKACLYLVENSKNEMISLMTKEAVAQNIGVDQKLTEGQKSALELILTTQDRVIGIQGVAGAGKTTLLKTLNRESRSTGYTLLGLSNSTAARQRLQMGSRDLSSKEVFLKSGIKSLTTRKFLMDCEKLLKQDEKLARLEYGGNKILVLDEASFTSTRELFALLNVIKKLDIRLVMLGDYKQLNSVEAGRIFYLLLGSNMSSIAINENVRFDSLKALRTMQFIYKDQIGDALQNLCCSLVEIPDREKRLKYIADLYLEKTLGTEKDTLVITPLHKDRKYVNQLVHEKLKEKGCLKGVEIEATILVPIDITEVEKQKIYSFQEEQWIRFNQAGLNIAIKAGEYCKILQKNYTDHTLLLERINGEKLYWSPERNIRQEMGALEVYKQEKVNVMAQEKIRWLKNDEKRGIRNGETARVLSVDENKMEVLLMDESKQVLDLSCRASQHWDCAYAATAHIAQGANDPDTIAHGIGGSKNSIEPPKLTSVEEFLVSVTRGDNVTLVVDNIEAYQRTLYLKLVTKRSTQEYLDPNREAVKAKVQKMTQNVTGRAEKKTLKEEVVRHSSSLSSSEKSKRYPSSRCSNQVQDWDKKSFIDKEAVNDYLETNILGYASAWLGPPHKKSGNEARWKGALTLNFKGSKAGMWKCWSSGQGGKDLISLYAYHYGLSWFEALQDLAKDLGLKREEPVFRTEKVKQAEAKRLAERKVKAEKEEKLLKEETIKRIKKAQVCYHKSIALANTLGEKYLRDYRGIQGKLPDDFRFCARIKHKDTGEWTPALIIPARNSQGEIEGITRIFLSKEGNKLKTTYIDALGEEKKAADKLSLGVLSKTEVIVNQGQSLATIYIAEGVETALSVAKALPEQKVVASLSAGRLQDIPLSPETKKVVICADEDGANADSNKSVADAINTYLAQGMKVEVAYPRALPNLDKTDFNDLLKVGGVNAVRSDFQQTIRIKELKTLSVSDLLQLKRELENTKSAALQPHYQTQKELER